MCDEGVKRSSIPHKDLRPFWTKKALLSDRTYQGEVNANVIRRIVIVTMQSAEVHK